MELIGAGALQAMGSAATLACTVVLAQTHGPAAQGAFNLVKAEIDFLSALFLFGLPQSLFYFTHKKLVDPQQATRLALAHGFLSFLLLIGWVLWRRGQVSSAIASGSVSSWIALAVAAAVAVGSIRGIVLAIWPTWAFAIMSAAPNLLLVVGVVVFSISGGEIIRDPSTTAVLLFSANFVCLIYLLATIYRKRTITAESRIRHHILGLARYGIAAWIPAVCQSATVVLALRWLSRQSTDLFSNAGVFAAALALVAIAVTPVGLIAPVLFKHWTKMSERERLGEFKYLAVVVACAGGFFILLVCNIGGWLVDKIFGIAYLDNLGTFKIISLIVIPQCLSKLWGVLFSSSGVPAIAAIIDVVRLAVFVTLSLILGHAINSQAMSLVAAEYFSLVLGITLIVATRLWSSDLVSRITPEFNGKPSQE